MADKIQLSSIRVSAELEASKYKAGADQKVAADKAMVASGQAVASNVVQLDTKISQSGDVLARLSRKYIDGYAAAQQYNSALGQLNRGIDQGKISTAQATAILDGMILKHDAAAAAVRRQATEYANLAAAGRQALAADLAQGRFNTTLGVLPGSGAGNARASAAVFESEMSRLEEIARQKAKQIGETFGTELNDSMRANLSGKVASQSGSVFTAEFDRLDEIARQKGLQAGANFSAALEASFAPSGKSARASMAVFEEAQRETDQLAAKVAALRAELNPTAAAQDRLNAELAEYAMLASRGAISATELGQAQAMARQRSQAQAGQGGVQRFAGMNAAFQIQDIAMMSMLGQAPLAVGLQQGPQLAMSMAQGGGMAALGAGLASLVSMPMLITVGLTVATAAVVQYFAEWASGSDESAKALEKQASLIDNVAKHWGTATPALAAYNTEVQKQAGLTELGEATAGAVKRTFDEVNTALDATTSDIGNLAIEIQRLFPNTAPQINQLRIAFDNLNEGFDAGTTKVGEANRVHGMLALLFRRTGIPAVGEFANKFGDLAQQIEASAVAAEKLNAENLTQKIVAGLGALNALGTVPLFPGQTEEDRVYEAGRRLREEEADESFFGGLGSGGAAASAAANIGTVEAAIAKYSNTVKSSAQIVRESKLTEFGDFTNLMSQTAAVEAQIRTLTTAMENARNVSAQKVFGQIVPPEALKALREAVPEVERLVAEMAEGSGTAQTVADGVSKITDELMQWAGANNIVREFVANLLDTQNELLTSADLAKALNDAIQGIQDKTIHINTVWEEAARQLSNPIDSSGGGGAKFTDPLTQAEWDDVYGRLPSNSGETLQEAMQYNYASGGFTGHLPTSRIAGVVHGGEYVMDATTTRAIGIANLDAIRRGVRGYADGGAVSAGGGMSALEAIDQNTYDTVMELQRLPGYLETLVSDGEVQTALLRQIGSDMVSASRSTSSSGGSSTSTEPKKSGGWGVKADQNDYAGLFTPGWNNDPNYSHYAYGGVANQPSIFGEAGPEAAVPLRNGKIPVEIKGGGGTVVNMGGITINVPQGSDPMPPQSRLALLDAVERRVRQAMSRP